MGSVYIRLGKGELDMKQLNQFMFPLGSFFFFDISWVLNHAYKDFHRK